MIKKVDRPANMSLLDYLWTYYGSLSTSDTPSEVPQSDILLTETAINLLIQTVSALSIVRLLYRDNLSNPDEVLLVGIANTGEELSVVNMPKEVHTIFFGGSKVTVGDINKGCPFPLGSDIIKLELSNGDSYYVSPEQYQLKVKNSPTIGLEINEGVLEAALLISKKSTGIILDAENDGVSARLEWSNINN